MKYNSYVRRLERQLATIKSRDRLRPDKFWGYPERWPIDGAGLIFLGRAVDRFGSARFGAAWQGVHFTGRDKAFPRSRDKEFASPTEVAVICRNLSALEARKSPHFIIDSQELTQLEKFPHSEESEVLAWKIATHRLSNETWDEACDRIDDEDLRPGPSMKEQWDFTLRSIHQLVLSGRVSSFLRPREGGVPIPLESNLWNTDVWKDRFERCDLDPQRPFSHTEASGDDWSAKRQISASMYVYLSLDEFVSVVPGGDVSYSDSLGDQYLPPFIHLMIRVSRELGLGKEGAPLRKALIVEALKRGWRDARAGEGDMGEAFWSNLATAMREPGTQARRNSPEGKKV